MGRGNGEVLDRGRVDMVDGWTITYQVHFPFHWEFCQGHQEWVQSMASGTDLHVGLVGPVAGLGTDPCFINTHSLVTAHQQGSGSPTTQMVSPAIGPHAGVLQEGVDW